MFIGLSGDRLLNVRQRLRKDSIHCFALHSRCDRNAERHERSLILRVLDHTTIVEQHDPRLRNNIVDGAALHPLIHSDPTDRLWHRAVRMGRVADSTGLECTYHIDR